MAKGDSPAGRPWRRALVTGASSGIGEAIARSLAGRSCDLVVVARSADRLASLADELPVEVEVLRADLSVPEQLAAVEERVSDESRPVDLVVNNAGLGFAGPVGEVPVERAELEIRVNVLALMRITHAAVRTMRSRGSGTILQVSSVAGFQPGPGGANYAATKAYVNSFSLALAEELRGSGVTVTVLCPGFTRTEFQARGNYDTAGVPEWLWQTPEEVAEAGLKAAEAGRVLCIPGAHNRVGVVFARHAPLPLVRRVAGIVGRRFR